MGYIAANAEDNTTGLRLLIGDTSPLVAAGLAAMLTARGHVVVANVGNGADAAAAIAGGDIDVALLDLGLSDPTPMAIMGSMRGRRAVRVVVMAQDGEHAGLVDAIEAGVDGIVLKSQGPATLDMCLATVAAGGPWHDRRALAAAFERRRSAGAALQLTRRERDVARLVATGQRNRIIAGALGISEGTVKMHLHNVYAKMGVESRTQLAMDARVKALD
ncbi:DNA-binding response regulator [Polymorphobacter glacialis]|uniref:DNA-binding response regulator n=1 Tax=Sandarakinorhabdus glacialis TaxID=1614636 RepID=A0A917E739_9SPHN|nr:response regulator transcription factor [Polymorphobacter glacialis]GGE05678.1 DNA-binding response regulator [Polymorphobacter glacialis]